MALPTKLTDRGTYWSVSYDDGSFDDIPKDPNALDTAAAAADLAGQKDRAARYRAYAENIRQRGVPVIIPSGTSQLAVFAGLAIIGFLLFRKIV